MCIRKSRKTFYYRAIITLQLLQPFTKQNMTELITSIVLINGYFFYMFIANYVG